MPPRSDTSCVVFAHGHWVRIDGCNPVLRSIHICRNTIRLWAGGVYEYEAWYDAADEFGLVVLHDLMFIEQGHGPCCPFYACASAWSCHQHPNVRNASQRAFSTWA